jgi:hypothetical protein
LERFFTIESTTRTTDFPSRARGAPAHGARAARARSARAKKIHQPTKDNILVVWL